MIGVLKLLEHEKNSRFHPDPNAKPLNEFDPKTDISYLRILVDNKLCLPYNKYKEVSFFTIKKELCIRFY